MLFWVIPVEAQYEKVYPELWAKPGYSFAFLTSEDWQGMQES